MSEEMCGVMEAYLDGYKKGQEEVLNFISNFEYNNPTHLMQEIKKFIIELNNKNNKKG